LKKQRYYDFNQKIALTANINRYLQQRIFSVHFQGFYQKQSKLRDGKRGLLVIAVCVSAFFVMGACLLVILLVMEFLFAVLIILVIVLLDKSA
jgi:Flp pilus assembly protein TadB